MAQRDSNEVSALFRATDGKLWFGTCEHGAAWLDPTSLQLHRLSNLVTSAGSRDFHAIAQSGPDRI